MNWRPVRSALLTSVLIALTLVVLALPTAVHQPWLRPALARAGLVQAEPSFVELSFSNPAAIRTFVTSIGDVNLDFEVTSHLPAATDVRWSVTSATEGRENGEDVLRTGTFGLAPGQRIAHQVASHISCGARRIRVTVTVAPASDSSFEATTIHFWVRGERAATTTICQLG